MTKISDLTGSHYPYAYRAVPQLCEMGDIERYCGKTRASFAKIAKRFDDAAHTEWLVRSYLALKYILGATVLASSAEHAKKENLRIVIPYSNYYAMLSCSRAFILTRPDLVWAGLWDIHGATTKRLRRSNHARWSSPTRMTLSLKSTTECG